MMGRRLLGLLALTLATAPAPSGLWAAASETPAAVVVAPSVETSSPPPSTPSDPESPPPGAGAPDPWTVAVGSRHRVIRDPAFDVFSEDDVLRGFDISLVRRVVPGLSVGLGWQVGSASEPEVLGGYRFSFLHHGAALVARYESVELGRVLVGGDWLRPTARAEVGVALGRASVTLGSAHGGAGQDRLQWRAVPVGHGGVGVRIFPFAANRVLGGAEAASADDGRTFAVEAEVGWSLLTPMNFDALEAEGDPPSSAIDTGAVDEGSPAITRHPVGLGEMTLAGAEFRIGALMRF